ncbi:MAG: hypothetical protein V2J20_13105 [Wenzhouxiangella sp.]|nr:hypothetical protein [Wenzhouxiangella sp.]
MNRHLQRLIPAVAEAEWSDDDSKGDGLLGLQLKASPRGELKL